ncbi:MAG: single-stranded-DNA-specific exonuclease RecJ [Lachnospiraceae bacterium]|nr:single-stranded-DNA-specific exonuclease RecJ [Lachnospiraceae bacterium]
MLARILINKGIKDSVEIESFLNGDISMLNDPHLMKDMDRATEEILTCKNEEKRVLIIGDYDIDGICSSYILKRGLKDIGIIASVRLPDRVMDGYGMNRAMIDEAYENGMDLILTCDNGIAAFDETEYAASLGIKVIITDHHEVPFETDDKGEKSYIIPKALAVVDPKQKDCSYPFEGICGGVVAYKLIECLYERCGIDKEKLYKLLPYAAFATVGDIMPLTDENRIIVKYGLKLMQTTADKGLNALINATGVDRTRIAPYHIGFILGPCINATGRLDTPDRALKLFLTEDEKEAAVIASELKTLNDNRKEIQTLYTKKAVDMVEGDPSFLKDTVLVLYLPDCHESLAGLIAGKLKEKYSRPSFVLTKGADCVKGSGRSIEAYDMYEEMNKCSDLFLKFGGHKMAAGLSLEEKNVPEFRKRINELSLLTEEDMEPLYRVEMQLHMKGASLSFAKELERLSPYGNGNEKPLFAEKDLKILKREILGKNNNTVKLIVAPKDQASDPELKREALIFGDAAKIMEEIKDKEDIMLVFELAVNYFKGTENVQLLVRDYRI